MNNIKIIGASGKAYTIGANIRKYRKRFGWSQKNLAEEAEVSLSKISRWENNIGEPTVSEACKIMYVLDISFENLIE